MVAVSFDPVPAGLLLLRSPPATRLLWRCHHGVKAFGNWVGACFCTVPIWLQPAHGDGGLQPRAPRL